MDGVELFLLGRTLMKIGEEAIPAAPGEGAGRDGGARLTLVVASDIAANGETSVGEIVARTGLPQSRVSTAVARLREAGAIESAADPADRRRTLVRPASRVSDRVAAVRAADTTAALTAALAGTDPAALAEVQGALDVLARHLAPRGRA
ncbi:MarR family transcriptional regulator [Streptomyces sp. ms191]|uniref:MarR family transcriptional regulator n=1 Tax=unclassified Streptomyces TaxID=2593676 RepID=UPI0011CE7C62|nr:helix-turn-helix domain-containing protein [Streptomyces sp. ms191]TXS21740.1 MarR family transcriptional regulator [Streptomyces sp. ms191]